jgi:hypothetical protein
MSTAPQEFHHPVSHDLRDADDDVASERQARNPGEPGVPHVPEGYPEEVDPSEGPLAGRDPELLGDLHHPGAPHHQG